MRMQFLRFVFQVQKTKVNKNKVWCVCVEGMGVEVNFLKTPGPSNILIQL